MNPYASFLGLSELGIAVGLISFSLTKRHLLTPKNVCLWKR